MHQSYLYYKVQIMAMLAVKYHRKLKNCDIKQDFCTSTLPDNEKYILRPPLGCPKTDNNTYLLLKQTLYGLKRSPRHFFDKLLKELVEEHGLEQCPNAPCLFKGTLIEGQPPIYIDTYVDDLIYFSTSDEVEAKFELLLPCSFLSLLIW